MFGSRRPFSIVGMGQVWSKGEHGGIIAILGDLQQQVAGYDVVVPYHAPCHWCDLAFKSALTSEHEWVCCKSHLEKIFLTNQISTGNQSQNFNQLTVKCQTVPQAQPQTPLHSHAHMPL